MADWNDEQRYPNLRATLLWGLLGGFLGALAMAGIALMMPVPMTGGAPFFVAAAMKMGLTGTVAWVAGWMFHFVTGLVVGAIFAVVVASARVFRLSSIVRAASIGPAAGLVVWIVLFLPMMATLMPPLLGMPTMVVGSFVAHLILGGVLGGVTYVGVYRTGRSSAPMVATRTCPSCAGTFPDTETLHAHAASAHGTKPEGRKGTFT